MQNNWTPAIACLVLTLNFALRTFYLALSYFTVMFTSLVENAWPSLAITRSV